MFSHFLHAVSGLKELGQLAHSHNFLRCLLVFKSSHSHLVNTNKQTSCALHTKLHRLKDFVVL